MLSSEPFSISASARGGAAAAVVGAMHPGTNEPEDLPLAPTCGFDVGAHRLLREVDEAGGIEQGRHGLNRSEPLPSF
jgi:hypothetical protein